MRRIILRLLGLYIEALAFIAPSYAARTGFYLFCRPYRLDLSKKQIAFFNTAERFTMSHKGFSIQGYRWGHGPRKVLFLHGWQSHTYRWKHYIEALAGDEYSIYSFDAPGHGLSSGKFLSVPLYSMLIEEFLFEHQDVDTVIGHSLGGFSLLYTLYRVPSAAVNRVVLLGTPGEASDFIKVFQRTLQLSDRTVAHVITYFAKRYNVTPAFFSAEKFAAALKVKGLIIHDEDDREAPYEYARRLSDVWSGSTLVTTKGFGHNLKSPSVVSEVVKFVQAPIRKQSSVAHS